MNTAAQTVTEALETRLSVRDFLPTPVPLATIRQVLATASRAPSGGNVQPWRIDVVTGARLDELKAIMQRRLAEVAAGDRSESAEYDIYPKELVAPHRDYRFKIGEDMYARLGIPPDRQTPQTALYLTPGGVTSGQGSLIDAIIRAAGFANFQTEPGWREIPLERLARAQPDLIAAAFFTQTQRHQDIWSAARHPLITNAMTDRPVAQLDSAWISCGGWFLVEAVERLRAVAGAAPS